MDKANNNGICNFYRIPDEPIMPPTRQCLICEALENPNADFVNTFSAWICQECKNRLKQMLYPKEGK